MTAEKERGSWGSKLGFILAAAGSAVGLGNIWRFPYVTGQNGGAAFVLIYILFVAAIGVPVMIAEIALGRHTRHSPMGAFRTLAPRGGWFLVGLLGVLTGIGILSYYSVVAGWTLGYFFKTLLGTFSSAGFNSTEAQLIFNRFVADPFAGIGYFALFLFLSALVVMGGVSGGIERAVRWMMPLLFILLLLLTIRSLTLEGAGAGLNFYLKPDFTKLTPNAVVMALGQALFSLSLGMGAMITYGSYLHEKENIVSSAAYVCLFDTLIAVLAGFLIFPALFAMQIDPAQGAGLVFIVLPTIFPRMIFGTLFGAAFFLLLAIAALTSTISLLEVAVAYMVDEHKWRRRPAVIAMTLLAFVLGLPSALSFGAVQKLTQLPGLGVGFLDLMNILMGNYSLTLGALLVSIFVGYKWGVSAAFQEITAEGNSFPYRRLWAFLIRFICPIAILVIFVYILFSKNYF
ncbi:MAG: sodium-dependent transporter [candidate division KSB1 bacterium]|nr:sodium-dependent transporter [candidate division KSB1 bacterium]